VLKLPWSVVNGQWSMVSGQWSVVSLVCLVILARMSEVQSGCDSASGVEGVSEQG
jgi:hypothetical protein